MHSIVHILLLPISLLLLLILLFYTSLFLLVLIGSIRLSNPLKQKESEVEKPVCSFARSLGWEYRKQQGLGQRGKLDRFFIKKHRKIVFVEFKAPDEKASELQKIELDKLEGKGFIAVLIDNIEDGQLLFKFLEDSFTWDKYQESHKRFDRDFKDYKEKHQLSWDNV